MNTILLYYLFLNFILFYSYSSYLLFLQEVVPTPHDINIHVKNVRKESWERFKQELERISGSERPGLGKALSDAMDYYVEHVLSNRSTKEWGGGVKKKPFKREEKLNKLISELINDLRREKPRFWDINISFDIELEMYFVTYRISEKNLKHAIRSILSVVDRHTIRNYIESLEALKFLQWNKRSQTYELTPVFRENGYEMPLLHRTRLSRSKIAGTPEFSVWGRKEEKKPVKNKDKYRDLPIIIPINQEKESIKI